MIESAARVLDIHRDPDARREFDGMAQDAALLHALGRDLANSRAWPNWSQDSEFRAIREQSAPERGAATASRKPGERG